MNERIQVFTVAYKDKLNASPIESRKYFHLNIPAFGGKRQIRQYSCLSHISLYHNCIHVYTKLQCGFCTRWVLYLIRHKVHELRGYVRTPLRSPIRSLRTPIQLNVPIPYLINGIWQTVQAYSTEHAKGSTNITLGTKACQLSKYFEFKVFLILENLQLSANTKVGGVFDADRIAWNLKIDAEADKRRVSLLEGQ